MKRVVSSSRAGEKLGPAESVILNEMNEAKDRNAIECEYITVPGVGYF